MTDHAALIDALSRSATPVTRPLSPGARAAWLIAAALPGGMAATFFLRTFSPDWSRPIAMLGALEILLSLLLGTGAIVTALAISIPGRRFRIGGWYLPATALWFAANALGIALSRHPIGGIGSGTYCFGFMMIASLPMLALAILHIRRTRAVHPEAALAAAGLGIAFLTSTLLGFCHPATGSLIDFTVHIVAAALIVGLTMLCGRRWVAI